MYFARPTPIVDPVLAELEQQRIFMMQLQQQQPSQLLREWQQQQLLLQQQQQQFVGSGSVWPSMPVGRIPFMPYSSYYGQPQQQQQQQPMTYPFSPMLDGHIAPWTSTKGIVPWSFAIDQPTTSFPMWIPRAEVHETDKQVIVKIELPGVKREQVFCEVTPECVRIVGEKSKPGQGQQQPGQQPGQQPAMEGIPVYADVPCGRFVRIIPLPSRCDVDKCTGRFVDGVLVVQVGKAVGGAKDMCKALVIQ